MFQAFIEKRPEIKEYTSRDNIVSMTIKFPYDLRASLEMKMADSSDITKWTAFVNRTGTLIHIVGKGPDGNGIIVRRSQAHYPVSHMPLYTVLMYLGERLKGWINLRSER